jgi:hypothetical protein
MSKLPKELIDKIIFQSGPDNSIKTNNKYAIKKWEKIKECIIEPRYIDDKYTRNFSYNNLVWGNIKFPDINSDNLININMMPFILQDINSLPDYLKDYFPLVYKSCANISPQIKERIAYLTIHESFVEKGKTQRRPGLHTDRSKISIENQVNLPGTIHWGGGPLGGIIIGSNLANTTKIYDCIVKDEIIGKHGSLEHVRELITKEKFILNKESELILISDHTPHEALPMTKSGYRQFFRLVFGKVDVWYTQHSTPNPLGIVPSQSTKIINDNKFD